MSRSTTTTMNALRIAALTLALAAIAPLGWLAGAGLSREAGPHRRPVCARRPDRTTARALSPTRSPSGWPAGDRGEPSRRQRQHRHAARRTVRPDGFTLVLGSTAPWSSTHTCLRSPV
jgi:hypothetical protein